MTYEDVLGGVCIYFAVQFLCIYPAVLADYIARLLRTGGVSASTSSDGVAGAGVVLFLRLLGCPLCSAVVRLDLLELLVWEADRGGFTKAGFLDGRHRREYCFACLLQVHGFLFGNNQCRFRVLL